MKRVLTTMALAVAALSAQAANIEILTVFTEGALKELGGANTVAGYNSGVSLAFGRVSTAISQINTAFAQSGVTHTVSSAGIYFQPIGDTSYGADVVQVTGGGGTSALYKASIAGRDTVKSIRNALKADLVVAMTESFGGLSGPGQALSIFGTPATAFAAVWVSEAINNSGSYRYVYAHEVGHLLGLHHQIDGGAQANDAGGPSNAHGYWVRISNSTSGNNCFHDLMSYASNPAPPAGSVTCRGGVDERQLKYSNPAKNFGNSTGSLTGVAYEPNSQAYTFYFGTSVVRAGNSDSDAATVINGNGAAVAAFGDTRLHTASTDFMTIFSLLDD